MSVESEALALASSPEAAPASTVVMKFGGTSVADAERIKRAARRIVGQREAGNRVVAVLSARGQTTDELIAMAEEVSPYPDRREMDMLLSTGERISNYLLWQCAYSEFVFTPVLWPDFSRADFEAALASYGARKRRFGGR